MIKPGYEESMKMVWNYDKGPNPLESTCCEVRKQVFPGNVPPGQKKKPRTRICGAAGRNLGECERSGPCPILSQGLEMGAIHLTPLEKGTEWYRFSMTVYTFQVGDKIPALEGTECA